MYYLAFSPLTNPIKHPSRGMKSPLRRNKSPFTLHDKPESLYCLTQRGEISHSHCLYTGQIGADYVCSSLYKRGNERRALTMGSTPTKENMESRFTLLLFSLHNERTADGWFLSDLFVWDTRETSNLSANTDSLLQRPGEEKKKRLTLLHGPLVLFKPRRRQKLHIRAAIYSQACQHTNMLRNGEINK